MKTKGRKELIINNSGSVIEESYKTLRSNILFSSVDKNLQVILVTSAIPGEGKTTTSSNLAIVMAQAGNKTLLLDCDLRKPNIHKAFGLSNQVGLTNYLIGEADISQITQETQHNDLHVITLGIKPPNPSELLGSDKMRNFIDSLRESYDYIILDTPPVIPVTDALILAQYSDGCMLVVSAGETHKDAVIKAKRLITDVNGYILGVILNKTDTKRGSYYSNYNYYYEYTEKEKGGKRIRGNRKQSIPTNQ